MYKPIRYNFVITEEQKERIDKLPKGFNLSEKMREKLDEVLKEVKHREDAEEEQENGIGFMD